jgi:hypothetical protein
LQLPGIEKCTKYKASKSGGGEGGGRSRKKSGAGDSAKKFGTLDVSPVPQQSPLGNSGGIPMQQGGQQYPGMYGQRGGVPGGAPGYGGMYGQMGNQYGMSRPPQQMGAQQPRMQSQPTLMQQQRPIGNSGIPNMYQSTIPSMYKGFPGQQPQQTAPGQQRPLSSSGHQFPGVGGKSPRVCLPTVHLKTKPRDNFTDKIFRIRTKC